MNCAPVPTATAITEADVCANCGKEGSDTIKLKNCTACFLVKYCGVDCQKIHRKKHKGACKKPEAHSCAICLLAIPFPEHGTRHPCCMKAVCHGCSLAAHKRGLRRTCPFCRSPPPQNDDEFLVMIQKRVAARDPEAICQLGDEYFNGFSGLEKDLHRAHELWSEAAELGSTTALYKVGMEYCIGSYYGSNDKAKGIHCFESAAIQGDVRCRHCLGGVELEKGNYDRAVRHFLISAKMGLERSLDAIKDLLFMGFATKAQYAEALSGCQDAVEEMKSPDRDEAFAAFGAELDALNDFT